MINGQKMFHLAKEEATEINDERKIKRRFSYFHPKGGIGGE